MKARVADELSRSDLTSQIALAINDAITHYQRKRFYFNETGPNGYTFLTVPNQETYAARNPMISQNADGLVLDGESGYLMLELTGSEYEYPIPVFYDVDDVFVTVGVNNFRVKRIDPTIYRINQMPNFKGQPYNYMYSNQTFSFSPIPNAIYPMQVVGHLQLDAPLDDTETNNPWMIDAERLIRNCAKRILCQEVIMDADSTAAYLAAENEALDSLAATTDNMIRTGYIQPVDF